MSSTERRINWGETIVPGLTVLFLIAYFFQTRDASIDVLKWPIAIAAIVIVLMILVLCFFLYAPRPSIKKPDLGKALLLVIAPVLYIATMPYLGFALGSLLFLGCLFRFLGSRSWWRTCFVAVLITAILYVATIVLMDMSLPRLELGSFVL